MAEPAPPRPARADDAGGIACVHVESWRTTYPGMLPARYLAAMDVRDYEERWERTLRDPYQRSSVFVVEEDGRLVGFASCGRERDGDPRYEGELYAIYLLDEARGRGHGRRLVRAAADELAAPHLTPAVRGGLRANAPAPLLYERLAGVYLRDRPVD